MRNHQIALAVAAMLGVSAAAQAEVDLYITGASAQRTAVTNLLKSDICTGGAAQEYRAYDSTIATNSAQPDFRAFVCTSKPTLAPGGGATAIDSIVYPDFPTNTRVEISYSAELGSIWGIVPAIKSVNPASALPTTHLFLDPNANCTLDGNGLTGVHKGNYLACRITGYNDGTDAVTTNTDGALSQKTPDVLLTDVEPTLFLGNGVNWPLFAGSTIFSAANAPSKSVLTTLAGNMFRVNGQVFAPIVDPTLAANIPTTLNLSKSTIASIFGGAYKYWAQVPGVTDPAGAPGTQIVVCRRDPGSGTQVAAQTYFLGGSSAASCVNSAPAAFVTTAAPKALGAGNVITNNSTDDLVSACMVNNAGHAIGFRSLASEAATPTFKLVSIDGIAPRAINAAAGSYAFAFETWGNDQSGANADPNVTTLAGGLLSRSQTASLLPKDNGTATSTQPAYGLPDAGGNAPSKANTNPTTGAPTALFSRGGDSCKVPVNINAN